MLSQLSGDTYMGGSASNCCNPNNSEEEGTDSQLRGNQRGPLNPVQPQQTRYVALGGSQWNKLENTGEPHRELGSVGYLCTCTNQICPMRGRQVICNRGYGTFDPNDDFYQGVINCSTCGEHMDWQALLFNPEAEARALCVRLGKESMEELLIDDLMMPGYAGYLEKHTLPDCTYLKIETRPRSVANNRKKVARDMRAPDSNLSHIFHQKQTNRKMEDIENDVDIDDIDVNPASKINRDFQTHHENFSRSKRRNSNDPSHENDMTTASGFSDTPYNSEKTLKSSTSSRNQVRSRLGKQARSPQTHDGRHARNETSRNRAVSTDKGKKKSRSLSVDNDKRVEAELYREHHNTAITSGEAGGNISTNGGPADTNVKPSFHAGENAGFVNDEPGSSSSSGMTHNQSSSNGGRRKKITTKGSSGMTHNQSSSNGGRRKKITTQGMKQRQEGEQESSSWFRGFGRRTIE